MTNAWNDLTGSKHSVDFVSSSNPEAVELTDKWTAKLESLGHTPMAHDVEYAKRILSSMVYPFYIDKPVLVTASPGFGKSTMLSVYLREKVRTDDYFGAIVVKERIEDLEALADEINIEFRSSGGVKGVKRYAYQLRGYEPKTMTFDEYRDQFTEQTKYPIVLLTMKQFELQVLAGNLSTFSMFADDTGSKRPRRQILIDEQPNLVITESFNYDDLMSLKSKVFEASKRHVGRKRSYVPKIHGLISTLEMELYELGEEKQLRKKLEPIDFKYTLPREVLADFSDVFDIEEIRKLRAFERAIGYGGELNLYQGVASVTSSYRLDYDLTAFNSFIFDGTADDDLTYNTKPYYVVKPTHNALYKNFHIHVCRQFSMSGNAIGKNKDCIPKMAEEVDELAGKHEGDTLVVTHSEYKQTLEKNVKSDTVRVKYFNGGRGTNKFQDCRNVILFGALDKGPAYYSQTVKALLDGILDVETSQHQEGGRAYRFDEPAIETYRTNDKATSTTQEVHRIRVGRKVDIEVHFYFFINDESVIEDVVARFPGCQVHEHVTYRKLNGAETAADRVIEYFIDMPEGSKEKGKEIYSYIGIDRKTFGELLKDNERVIEAMKRFNIVKQGHSYVKA